MPDADATDQVSHLRSTDRFPAREDAPMPSAERAARPGARLAGRVAVVTGASRGIGRAIAEAFVAEGARVVITGRKPEPLAEAAAEMGDAVRWVAGNAGDDAAAVAACERARDELGSLDVLVNNAATNAQFGPLIDAELGAVDKVFQVNLRGPLVWSQVAWRTWLRDHGGVILNIASNAAIRPNTNLGAYSISKAGLVSMTRVLAAELAPRVRVNALAPAVTRTRMASGLVDTEDEIVARYPMGRLGEPADTAAAAVFLCSDDASWITGITLPLDGGENAARFRRHT
jgi:NAD(P)-dependent dehydrogenase (short-subunit alcohol dehydrogenase family)